MQTRFVALGAIIVIVGALVIAYGYYPSCPTGTFCVDSSRGYFAVGISIIVIGMVVAVAGAMVYPRRLPSGG